MYIVVIRLYSQSMHAFEIMNPVKEISTNIESYQYISPAGQLTYDHIHVVDENHDRHKLINSDYPKGRQAMRCITHTHTHIYTLKYMYTYTVNDNIL